MPLIDSEQIKKFITDGLNTGRFGNDAVQILTELEYAPVVEAYTPDEIGKILQYRWDICHQNPWCSPLCKIGHPCMTNEKGAIQNILRAMKEG